MLDTAIVGQGAGQVRPTCTSLPAPSWVIDVHALMLPALLGTAGRFAVSGP